LSSASPRGARSVESRPDRFFIDWSDSILDSANIISHPRAGTEQYVPDPAFSFFGRTFTPRVRA